MVEGPGPRIDDIWRDADMVSRRETLAQRFLCGRGIEIGALHKPLTMPKDVRAEYVDYKTLEENRARYPELSAEPIVETHIVDDGFVLSKFEAKSVDFIVANHALEHSPDAYGTLARWAEKTRAGGILFFAVPIADRCFDRGRELTTVEHLLNDHDDFVRGDWGRALAVAREHLLEFVRVSDANIRREGGLPSIDPKDAETFVGSLVATLEKRFDAGPFGYDGIMTAFVEGLNKVYDVHYHTFCATSLEAFIDVVCDRLGMRAEALEKSGGGEVIAVLRIC